MVVIIRGGYIVTLFIHLVTLLMRRAGKFCWSGVAGRICFLEAGKRGSRSYGAQGARTTTGRFVMRRGRFLVEYYVRKWIELLCKGSCVFRKRCGQQVGEAAWSEWGLQQKIKTQCLQMG